MKKSPAITDATRQAFVDAFLQLHKKKPINKITVREIVEITGNLCAAAGAESRGKLKPP